MLIFNVLKGVLLRHQASAVRTDVTDEEQVAALARRAVETFGRIDLWINNAAVTAFGSIEADHRGAGGSYLIAMPILATPQGIVAIIAIMAAAVILFDVTKVIVLVLVIMAIDLGVLLAADRIIRWIDPSTLQIIAWAAGILLLALVVQLGISALRDLGALAPLPGGGH